MSPVVVSRGRIIQPDLSIAALQQARESGIATSQQNNAILQQSMGQGDDPMTRLVESIKRNTDIDVLLKTIGLGFQGFNVNLTANQVAQVIAPSKTPRGYIILNPAETATFSNPITFFSSASRAAGTYTSTASNVSIIERVGVFLDITVAGGTLTVDAQSRDPVSGNWATFATDIFSGANTVGTFYANLGTLGVDDQIRLVATVTGAAITFSISGFIKGQITTPQGSTIYLGGPDVTTTFGYPLLLGQREYFYLLDNVALFAISPNNLSIKVFQLQGAS